MKFIFVYTILIFGCISPLMGRDPGWFSRRSTDLENAINIQDNTERIAALGEFMSLASDGEMDEQQKTLFNRAHAQLLAIPGHAEYYRDKILQAQERAKTIGPYALSNYANEMMYGFEILPHLPSPEGVRVLGELFSNDWVPPGNETFGAGGKFAPLSVCARVALQKFPLLSKPFRDPITRQNVADAQAAWQLWYEQIKAGNRTFRFEGDPTEYDLNGPASKEVIQRVERDRKRDDERAMGHKKSTVAPAPETAITQISRPSSVAWLVGGIGLIGAAVWYFVSGRKTAQGRI